MRALFDIVVLTLTLPLLSMVQSWCSTLDVQRLWLQPLAGIEYAFVPVLVLRKIVVYWLKLFSGGLCEVSPLDNLMRHLQCWRHAAVRGGYSGRQRTVGGYYCEDRGPCTRSIS